MEIIPAVDIRDGRCVRLYQGDYAQETVFPDSPVEAATRWVALGAGRLHVVDLDGARSGQPVNRQAIEDIIRAAEAPVEVGGGIRTIETVHAYLDAGAERVVIGTSALSDGAMVEAAAREHPQGIVVSVDARDGMVAVNGWTEQTREPIDAFVDRVLALGVRRLIFTDVSRDGTLTEPNYAALEALVKRAGVPVIAAGGIASVEHLLRLADIGVEGAIIGRALYTGDIALPEAMRALAERVAD
ncbi:MAG: 1-(5-phosphoribosyl)-5-[(5-phosphoribosylamino)methylideneamino]imidazole-4-carboxamide isomerase [Dehalococcoidia bacterium]|nr:1-(5-phosphoribosyl)-5-[(5-phosphoribosylamino)methylideneamino]imidazole-4-carboxamide isomerase [Dehalococcoidia bacterium]